MLDLAGEQQAHDLHERHLDGVGVFEHRQEKGGRAATAAIDVQTDALVPHNPRHPNHSRKATA